MKNRQLYRLAACLIGAASLLLQSCMILAGMDAMGEKYRAQGGKLYSKASE